jgi:SulP family sulfate permease
MTVSWGRWKPRLFDCLSTYNAADFWRDAIAGITVGLVALPLAMAFGIASGTSPQAGIYTAIVGGFLVSLFGGSRIQIGGPTGAFVVVVAAIIAQHGISGLYMVTMLAGAILLVMAFTGLGTAVSYIPRPIVIGFTNGIAVLIVSTQIKDFLGLDMAALPSEFIPRIRAYARAIGTTDPATLTLALTSLAVIILSPRLLRRVPGQIVALLGATATAAAFSVPVGRSVLDLAASLQGCRPFSCRRFGRT